MNDAYFEMKREIEAETCNSIDTTISLLNEKSSSIDDELLLKLFRWDIQLLSCNVSRNILGIYDYQKDEKMLSLVFGYGDGSKYLDLGNFEDDRESFYNDCLKHTLSSNLKIRYLDYLVDFGKRNKFSNAKQLVTEILSSLENIDNAYKMSYIQRLVNLVLSFKLDEKLNQIKDVLLGNILSDADLHNSETIKVFSVLRIIEGKKQFLIDSEKERLLDVLEKNIKKYFLEKDFRKERLVITELLNSESVYKTKKIEVIKYQKMYGESYEEEAELTSRSKSYFIGKAISYYQDIGLQDKIPTLKVKLSEANRGIEFQTITQSVEIPKWVMDMFLKQYIDDDMMTAFEILTDKSESLFIPNYEQIKAEALDIHKGSLTSLLTTSVYTDDRKIFQSQDGDNRYSTVDYYVRHVALSFNIYYRLLWNKLLDQGISPDIVIGKINSWQYLSDDDKKIISIGIERYFERDYVSSIHILVPRFENCFRKFFGQGGHPTTTIRDGIQKEQVFNQYLNQDFVVEKIGEDKVEFLRLLLVDELGLNLRNDVAHGLSKFDNLNEVNANIVLYLFFMLIKFEWEEE